jgi:chromosome segregation ATPase
MGKVYGDMIGEDRFYELLQKGINDLKKDIKEYKEDVLDRIKELSDNSDKKFVKLFDQVESNKESIIRLEERYDVSKKEIRDLEKDLASMGNSFREQLKRQESECNDRLDKRLEIHSAGIESKIVSSEAKLDKKKAWEFVKLYGFILSTLGLVSTILYNILKG